MGCIILIQYKDDSEREKKLAVLRQPRRLGLRYWIRLIIILLFTSFLLWYSHHTTNNPFIKHPYIKISHNESFFYLSCYEKFNRSLNSVLLFILQFYHSGSGKREEFIFPGTSILLTLDSLPNLEKNFTDPPSKWIILDSLNTTTNSKNTISDAWPKPLYSMNFSSEHTISIQPVFPFADTTRAIQFSFNSIDILILNSIPDQIDIDVSSIFRERYSIVINTKPHRNEIIQQIRKLFRPLFLIIVPLDSDEVLHGENGNSILAVTKKSTFIFYTGTKGTVQLK